MLQSLYNYIQLYNKYVYIIARFIFLHEMSSLPAEGV